MRSCSESNNCSLQSSGNLRGKLTQAANSSIQFHRRLGGNSGGGKVGNNLQMKQLPISCVAITDCHRSEEKTQMHEVKRKEKKKKAATKKLPPTLHLVRHPNPRHGLGWQFHLPRLSWLCRGWERACFPPPVACRAVFILGELIPVCRRAEAEMWAAWSRAHHKDSACQASAPDLHKPPSPQFSEVSDSGITASPLARASEEEGRRLQTP